MIFDIAIQYSFAFCFVSVFLLIFNNYLVKKFGYCDDFIYQLSLFDILLPSSICIIPIYGIICCFAELIWVLYFYVSRKFRQKISFDSVNKFLGFIPFKK